MFPLPFDFPFRKKDGSLSTLGDEMGGESYTLPTASANTKGGVKIGDGLTMDGEVLKNTNPTPPTPYTLPTASDNIKGGVKVGDGLAMDGETLNCTVMGGLCTKLWEWTPDTNYQPNNYSIELSSDDYDFLLVHVWGDWIQRESFPDFQSTNPVLKGTSETLCTVYQEWNSQSSTTRSYMATRFFKYVDDTHYKLSNGYLSGDNVAKCLVDVVYGVKL